jgi:CRISPR-associated protein Cmr4
MSEANVRMIYLHALTPIHSGTGQAASVIDLPIAREKATGWPVIPASSLKGVLRDSWRNNGNKEQEQEAFGSIDKAGALVLGDQRILCLPVRSFFGTFAYVTCPLALHRYYRDRKALTVEESDKSIPPVPQAQTVLVPDSSALKSGDKVYLEDLDLNAQSGKEVQAIANEFAANLFPKDTDTFVSRFAIVSDEVFNFLSETATEVTARVRLREDTKTVESGGLWYEEAVPAEAIFYGPVMLSGPAQRNGGASLLERLTDCLIQIGGKSSVGRGLCRMVVAK